MAANYYVMDQQPGIRELAPGRVLDVDYVGIITAPSGIYVSYPVDRASIVADNGHQILSALATEIEAIIADGLAVTGLYAQDTDRAGLLVDYLDFIIEYTPPQAGRGVSRTEARVDLGALIADSDPFLFNIGGNPREILLAAYDTLKATADQ